MLLLIVFLTSLISYIQERKSSALLASFKNLLPQNCRVFRDGHEKRILAYDLVLGDVVRINAGDKIPADVRIIDCDELKVCYFLSCF